MQPLRFLDPIYQLVADVALFSATFTIQQVSGLTIVCSVFFVELIYKWFFNSMNANANSQSLDKDLAEPDESDVDYKNEDETK